MCQLPIFVSMKLYSIIKKSTVYEIIKNTREYYNQVTQQKIEKEKKGLGLKMELALSSFSNIYRITMNCTIKFVTGIP